jgi:hypothetical protein
MKNLLKLTIGVFTLLIFCLSTNLLQAQIYVVQFMKVKPGMYDTYLEVEEAWSKLHQKSVDNGYILQWSLNEKMFSGSEDEYDFITVQVYKDWATYEKGLPDGYYDQLGEEVMQNTGDSRDLIRTEVYVRVAGAENSKPAKISQLVFMKVEQDNESKYINMERKFYKPFHESIIEAGGRNSWNIYQRIVPYGFGHEFNFVAVDGFENMAQQETLSSDVYDEAWEKAIGDTPESVVDDLTNESRMMVSSEMWMNRMSVPAVE